jgi:hypothetical protein
MEEVPTAEVPMAPDLMGDLTGGAVPGTAMAPDDAGGACVENPHPNSFDGVRRPQAFALTVVDRTNAESTATRIP